MSKICDFPPCTPRRQRLSAPHDGPVAQLDRALDYESKGRAFESLRVRHKNKGLAVKSYALFLLSETLGRPFLEYGCRA